MPGASPSEVRGKDEGRQNAKPGTTLKPLTLVRSLSNGRGGLAGVEK